MLVFRRELGIALVVDNFRCQIRIPHKISHKKPPEVKKKLSFTQPYL